MSTASNRERHPWCYDIPDAIDTYANENPDTNAYLFLLLPALTFNPTLMRPPTRCYVWGTACGGRSHALSQFSVYLRLYYTSLQLRPASAQYPALYPSELRRAHT